MKNSVSIGLFLILMLICFAVLTPANGHCQRKLTINVAIQYTDTTTPKSCTLLFKDASGRSITYVNVINRVKVGVTLDLATAEFCLTVLSEYHYAYRRDSCYPAGQMDSIHLVLLPKIRKLQEVIVTGTTAGIIMKGDTVQYDASRYRELGMRKMKELLTRMEGFSVSEDGRITYLGKELHSILVDGEDLTARDYQALSENLSSSIIDKVQVLQKYNANRLLREIDASDVIALNVTTLDKARGRVSGSLAAGAGSGGRFLGDGSLTSLSRVVRTLLFISGNNTGDMPRDVRDGLPDEESGVNTNRGRKPPDGIIKPSEIQLPFERSSYTRENSDGQFRLINAWKNKGITKFRSGFGLLKTRTIKYAESTSNIIVDQWNRWETENTQQSLSADQSGDMILAITADDSKNRVIQAQVGARLEMIRSLFDMSTTGDVNDLYREGFKRPALLLDGNCIFTKRLSGNRYLHWKSTLSNRQTTDKFSVESGRLSLLFGIDSGRISAGQVVTTSDTKLESSIAYIKKKPFGQFASSLTVAANTRNLELNGAARRITPDSLLDSRDTVISNATVLTVAYKQGMTVRLDKSTNLLIDASAGIAYLFNRSSYDPEAICSMGFAVQRKLTPFKSFFFNARWDRSTNNIEDIFAGPVLSGSPAIYSGLAGLYKRSTLSLSAGYFGANVFRGKHIVANASVARSTGQNIPDQSVNKQFAVYRYSTDGQVMMITNNCSLEKFVAPLRAKVSLNLSGSAFIQKFRLNFIDARNILVYTRLDLGYSTSFPKLNFDLHVARVFTINALELESQKQDAYQSRSSFNLKSRWKPVKNFRFNLDFSYEHLAPHTAAALFDFGTIVRLKKWATLSINMHNLFDRKSIRFVSVSPISTSSSKYELIPRYMLIKIALDF